jgi:hypothetical protein
MEMGIGKLGKNDLIFKRKFRWLLEVRPYGGGNATDMKYFVKSAARPNLTVEETEINFLNVKKWIPGKAAWETLTVTFYDVVTTDITSLWNWLASTYELYHNETTGDKINQKMGNMVNDYGAQVILTMLDGCGTELETWTLDDVWPSGINFGDLDYSSSEEATIELTLRYSIANYQSKCPDIQPTGKCTPCAI